MVVASDVEEQEVVVLVGAVSVREQQEAEVFEEVVEGEEDSLPLAEPFHRYHHPSLYHLVDSSWSIDSVAKGSVVVTRSRNSFRDILENERYLVACLASSLKKDRRSPRSNRIMKVLLWQARALLGTSRVVMIIS